MSMEERVRRALKARADLVLPSAAPALHLDEPHRARPTDARQRIAAALVAAAIGIAGIAVVVVAFGQAGPERRPGRTADPVISEVEIGRGAGRLAVAFGSVWIAMPDGVLRVDPTSGEILARIPVRRITPTGEEPPLSQFGGTPHGSGLAPAVGMMWVAAEPDLVGIDPSTNQIVRRVTESSGITNIASAYGSLLVGGMAQGIGHVRLVDPLATGSIYLKTWSSGFDAYPQVLATRHWYWAASGSVEKPPAVNRTSIDLSVSQRIDIPAVRSMAGAGKDVWFTTEDALYRVDASFSAKGVHIEPDMVAPLTHPSIVAGDGGALWLLETTPADSRLSILDLDTGQPDGEPVVLGHAGAAGMTVDNGTPFITFADDGVLISLGEQSPEPAPPPDDPDVSDVLRIRCDEEGTTVLTPIVAAQPDGVRVVVLPEGGQQPVEFRSPGSGGQFGGRIAADGDSHPWPVAPGQAQVACGKGAVTFEGAQPFEVVDAAGHWALPELACGEADRHEVVAYDGGAVSWTDEEAAIGGILDGVRADDRVREPLYGLDRLGRWVVLRNGEVVALVYYTTATDGTDPRGGGLGRVTGDACDSSGIAGNVPPRDPDEDGVALDCRAESQVAFRVTGPSEGVEGASYIRQNVSGIRETDVIVAPDGVPGGDGSFAGIWTVQREGKTVASVVYPNLEGITCRWNAIGTVAQF